MNSKKINQTITGFQIGAVLCLILAALFYVYPTFNFVMNYFIYRAEQDAGRIASKPVFPGLPPLIVGSPFFFAAIVGRPFSMKTKDNIIINVFLKDSNKNLDTDCLIKRIYN